jgi:hypothetical protein
MLLKPIEQPPAVAPLVEDMRAFDAKPNTIMRDENRGPTTCTP